MEFVTVEKKGRVVVIWFERDNKANSLSRQVKNELTETVRSSENDFETSATVLIERDDVFSLGHDLKDPWLADID
jgi:enoyl-CoA hydratase/carnithine racemase